MERSWRRSPDRAAALRAASWLAARGSSSSVPVVLTALHASVPQQGSWQSNARLAGTAYDAAKLTRLSIPRLRPVIVLALGRLARLPIQLRHRVSLSPSVVPTFGIMCEIAHSRPTNACTLAALPDFLLIVDWRESPRGLSGTARGFRRNRILCKQPQWWRRLGRSCARWLEPVSALSSPVACRPPPLAPQDC